MDRPTIITPARGILKRADIKSLGKSLPVIAVTSDNAYRVHIFTNEGGEENVLLSHKTDKGTSYHRVKINHHKYQTDTFTIGGKTYNMDTLKEM